MLTLRHGAWQRVGLEGFEEGVEGVDGPSSGGFEDGADVGVELGAPFCPEAVGDFAEGHARAQGALGGVVCRFEGAIGKEDEEVSADLADCLVQLDAFLVGGSQFE